jgi:hydrogenase/urease accessory protein HupE
MRAGRATRLLLFATVLVAALPLRAFAHALSPMLLDLREQEPGRFAVLWKSSPLRLPGSEVTPVLPAHCTAQGEATAEEVEASLLRRWTIDCGQGGLVGAQVGFSGLGPAKVDGLVRIALADGRLVRGVVRAGASTLTVPEAESAPTLIAAYIRLGFAHIITGLDHLLFVFGLLLLVRDPRLLVKTITAFTLGHSVTLSLAALGYVHFPSRPIEVVIALSVFLLAVELTRDAQGETLMRRRPWAVALGFGLLHGLGFAGALAEVGLPQNEIPLALFSFNIGIEIGQLAFVFTVLALRRLLRPATIALPRWAEMIPLYAMGSLAAYWVLERAATALAT